MVRRLLAVSVAALFSFGCSAARDDEPRFLINQQPIAGGELDETTLTVFGMYTQSGQGGGMCTGTLIAPNLLLTARHCVSPNLGGTEYVICGQSPFGAPYPGSNVYLTNDVKLSQYSSGWMQGAQVRVPSEGVDTCGFDVALIILASNSKVAPAIPRIDVEAQVGETYSAVGYGATGSGWGGSRRIRTGLTVQCTPGNCPVYSGVQSTEWGGETGVCQGDSGGPAFDADGKVIGVVSRGLQGCESPTYGGVWAWRNFITDVAKEAAELGGYEPPFWVLSGSSESPEPVEPTPTEPTEPVQGRECSEHVGCPSGFGCYDPGTDGPAFCAELCDATTTCSAGTQCLAVGGGAQVCTPPAGATDAEQSAGGCTVSSGSSDGPLRPVPWVVGAALFALGLRRRRP
ncbi:MAG: S1 family peptidase [Polyangiaceae bacterium]|nr:S1 family peptidase [Polyangiaceae bacterium]